TMVFAEVAGFEHVSRAMTPERFLQLLNRCFTALEPAVHAHGGVIDKYVSERVLALFGVPNAIEHAPRQALNAVIDMRRRLRRFLEEQGLLNRLHLHVGVNTGFVGAGEMGGLATRALSGPGDAVNVGAPGGCGVRRPRTAPQYARRVRVRGAAAVGPEGQGAAGGDVAFALRVARPAGADGRLGAHAGFRARRPGEGTARDRRRRRAA